MNPKSAPSIAPMAKVVNRQRLRFSLSSASTSTPCADTGAMGNGNFSQCAVSR